MKTRFAALLMLCVLNWNGVAQESESFATSSDAAEAGSLSALLAAAPACAPALDGLVSWWRAENSPLDSWGNNHGGATVKYETGEVGQGFTAASSMVVTNAPSLQLTNALTIEAWVKPPTNSGAANRSLVSKFEFAQFSNNRAGAYYLGLGSGNFLNGPVFMLTPTGYESNAVRLAPLTNLPFGQWSHLAATYDGAKMKLYLNGVLLAQSNYTAGIWPGTNNLGIGCTYIPGVGRTIYPANASLDEISIYRRALSDSEIAAIYNSGSAGKCPPSCFEIPAGAISWWPADGTGFDVVGTNRMVEGNSYATGRVGQVFAFPRAGSTALNSQTLNFGVNSNLSIEMWIQAAPTNSLFTNVPLLEKRTVSNAFSNSLTGVGYSLSLYQGRLAFWFSPNLATSNAAPFSSSGPNLADGVFHHVGVTLDRGNTNGGKLFVDGQPIFTFNPTLRGGSLSNSSPLYFGTPTSPSLNSAFTGLIDEAALYGSVLTDAEMQSIYQAGPAGKCKTPPAIITQPTGGRAVVGSNFTLRVVATGSAPKFRYQWRQDSVNLFGATNANFNFNPGKPGVTNRFSCLVTNSFGAVTSLVAVVAVNNRPIATNDGRTLNEDTSITFHLNGSDLDADPLTYAITLLPTHGTLLLASNFATSGLLAYQPNTNFSGLDIFTFRVNDGYENSDDVKVTITVLPVNDPPIADSQSVSLNEDTAAPITLTASDVDGDPLTFNVGVPQHGTLTGFAPNLSYQPFTNYNGPDQFSFTVNDGTTDSAPATVSLTVLPVNDPPVLVAQVFTRFLLSSNDGELRVIAGKDDLAHVVFDASLTTDVDNDPLTFVWKERAATNVLGSQVVATNTLPPGEHTIQLLVSDGIVTVTNEFLVQVITGDEAVDLFSDLVELSELKHGVRQPLLAMLHSAAHGFNAGLDWSGVHHLELVQDRIRDWVAPVDAELAEQWLWITQQILDIFGEIKPGNAGAVKMDQDAGGKQTLRFLGDRNRPYLIEASVDLIRWEVIGAAIERGPGRYEFNDLRPSDAPSRFYRIRTL